VKSKNNSPVNIRFVAKTSDIRNFSQNIRSSDTGWGPIEKTRTATFVRRNIDLLI